MTDVTDYASFALGAGMAYKGILKDIGDGAQAVDVIQRGVSEMSEVTWNASQLPVTPTEGGDNNGQ